MSQKKAMVAGHLCLDITPVFKEGQRTDKLFVPGKMIQMEPIDIHTGGIASNTGLAMKYLGADVKVVGKIGADDLGENVKKILKSHQAADDLIVSRETTTAYSVVLAPPGIDRMFLHHAGANEELGAEELLFRITPELDLFHFGYPPVMKRLYKNGGEELLKLYRDVKEMGVITSLDWCVFDENTEAGEENWPQIISDVLKDVDIFVPSVEELCSMVQPEVYEEWLKRAAGKDMIDILDLKKDVEPLARRVMEMGPKVLMVKCGSKGLYYETADKEELAEVCAKFELDEDAWAGKAGFLPSFKPARIRSATGAGDTCVAAFLTSMMRGYSLMRCLKLAAAEGASCVEAYDAFSGIRTLEELEAKIEAGWEMNEI